MKILAVITNQTPYAKILDHLGIPSEATPHRRRPPPQAELSGTFDVVDVGLR